jgi:hypothetical protein
MRTVLLVFCALLMMTFALEAKKKAKMPASQTTAISKQHKADMKKMTKARKAPKHRQRVN